MKKILALTLVLAMLLSMTACGLLGVKKEDLCGTWSLDLYQDAETVESILLNLDFYEEEIALIDLNSMACVMCVRFNEDNTYSYYFDIPDTKVAVRKFFNGAMEDLYAGRASLSAVYNEDLGSMSKDGFYQFYADLFGTASIDELIDSFVERAFDYDILAETLEEGTYRIVMNDIYKTPEGKTEESMGVTIENGILTLSYLDGDEVYTRK